MYSLTRCALHGKFVRPVIRYQVVFVRLVELMFGRMCNTLEKMFVMQMLVHVLVLVNAQ